MSQSSLERRFCMTWSACHGPVIRQEVQLIPGRKFRCDFLHEPTKTVIELEGFGKGHQAIGKFIQDAEKYLLLTLLGYRVIRLTVKQVNVEWITRIIAFLKPS